MTTEGRIIETEADRFFLLSTIRTVAVIGAKGEGAGPPYSVPQYLHGKGIRIIPVSPKLDELFSVTAVTSVDQIEEPVDVVQIFRRSEAVLGHVPEILAMDPKPRIVWMQPGIRNDDAAAQLTAAGLDVVQDQCLKSNHRRWSSPGAGGG